MVYSFSLELFGYHTREGEREMEPGGEGLKGRSDEERRTEMSSGSLSRHTLPAISRCCQVISDRQADDELG